MFRKILNTLIINGVWFAAMMVNIYTAFITTVLYTIIAMAIKWCDKHL